MVGGVATGRRRPAGDPGRLPPARGPAWTADQGAGSPVPGPDRAPGPRLLGGHGPISGAAGLHRGAPAGEGAALVLHGDVAQGAGCLGGRHAGTRGPTGGRLPRRVPPRHRREQRAPTPPGRLRGPGRADLQPILGEDRPQGTRYGDGRAGRLRRPLGPARHDGGDPRRAPAGVREAPAAARVPRERAGAVGRAHR